MVLMQKIQHKLFIILNIEAFDIDLRENINAALGLTADKPGMSFNA